MTRTKAARKPPMLVRVIEMKSAIVRSGVAHPTIVSRVHVWRVRVARLIAKILFHSSSRRSRRALWRTGPFRTMRRDMSAANLGTTTLGTTTLAMFLGRNDDRKAQQNS